MKQEHQFLVYVFKGFISFSSFYALKGGFILHVNRATTNMIYKGNGLLEMASI